MATRLIWCSAVLVLLSAASLEAQEKPPQLPPYWTLQTRHTHGGRHEVHRHPPRTVHALPVERYSYGWFGAQPRQHWSRSFGYHRKYTQWAGK